MGSPDFMEMEPKEMLAYLLRETGLTPVSRYGRDGKACAPVAVAVAVILGGETGEPVTRETLEYVMGLVVNDHDDIGYMLKSYGSQYGYDPNDFLPDDFDPDDTGDPDDSHDYLHGKRETQ